MSKAHPGFKKAAAGIEAKQHVSETVADKILAAGAHNASAKAKRENPRLLKVGKRVKRK